MPETELSSQNY